MSHRSHLVLASLMTCLGCFAPVDKLNAVEKNPLWQRKPLLTAQTDLDQNVVLSVNHAEVTNFLLASPPPQHQLFTSNPTSNSPETWIATTETPPNNAETPNTPLTTTLRIGSNGTQVQQLQQNLKDLGYFQATVDGIFTEATAEAVVAFQRAQGLDADGVVGETTWARLQSVIASKPKPSPSSEPTPAKRSSFSKRSLVRWVLIGLVLVTAAAGTVLLLLKLLNRPVEEDEDEEEEGLEPLSSELPLEETSEITNIPLHHHESEKNGWGLNGTPHHPELESPPIPESAHMTSEHETPPVAEPAGSESEASEVHSEVLAVGEMTRLAKISIVDELIRELDSPDVNRRRKAIWELGQRGNSQATGPLINLLMDSDSQQRSLILAALSEIGVQTLKPMNRALSMSLQDNNPEVRKNAIRDLTRIYELMGHVSQLMRYAAEDPDKEVRETAKWALNQLNRIRTVASGFEGNFEPESSRENFDRYPEGDEYR